MNYLLRNIEKLSPKFSKGHKRIADYIVEHYDKASFMTASKLGATVGVSESTVVRFAVEVGYDGYPQLQKAMQEMIKNKLTSVQRIEVAVDRLKDCDILSTVLNSDIEKIRHTIDEISKEDFEKAVDYLLGAEKIFIVAARSSAPIASFLNYYLQLTFDNVRLINAVSESEFFESMIRIGKKDAVVALSFPRYSTIVAKSISYAREKGAKVISITDSNFSPLVPHSDAVLIARSDMVGIVDSLVAPLSLINAIIVATALKRQSEISEVFTSLENVWDKFGIYEKLGDE